jgi:hypothetical protein
LDSHVKNQCYALWCNPEGLQFWDGPFLDIDAARHHLDALPVRPAASMILPAPSAMTSGERLEALPILYAAHHDSCQCRGRGQGCLRESRKDRS